ncbi:hypothetical protein P3L10_030851 [Capsicum annuum]
MASSFFPLSSTKSDSNPSTQLILHPNINLPSLIQPLILLNLSDFPFFKTLPHPFSHSSFKPSLFPKPLPLSVAPLQILDRDDIPIANLIPRRSRSTLKQKPSFVAIDIDNDTPEHSSPVIPSSLTPHTWRRKQKEDACLEEALRESKKKRVVPNASLPPCDSSPDILIRSKRKLKQKHTIEVGLSLVLGVLIWKLWYPNWGLWGGQPEGNHQRRFGKDEVYEFYTHGVAIGELISTSVHGKLINLYPADLGRILSVPTGGWGHYVKGSWPPLDNLPSALDICRNFFGNPLISSHHYEIPIDLPQLIIKHMQRVLVKDKNGHALPYQFWLAPMFDDFRVSVKLEVAQATLEAAQAIHEDEKRN